MPRFLFHVDGKKVNLDDIPDGTVKSLFVNVRDAMQSQLHSQQCSIHHSEPTVSLFSKDDRFGGYAVGTCCQEFSSIITPLVKVNIPGVDSTLTRLTRTMKYSSMG